MKHLFDIFIKSLEEHSAAKPPFNLYEPVDYLLQLGGKRVRPVLCLMACELFDTDVKKALAPAIGIEYFHNFTLAHDDIMDAAPLRRGKETMHTKYNLNTAILSGDVMFAKAYSYICQVDSSILGLVLQTFNQTAIEVCEGQQYDMDFETLPVTEVSVEDYLKMIELKTAVLIAASLKIGALVGGASIEEAQNLYEFGRLAGIAFQLQDDILDTYSTDENFGKQVGGDIIQNKKTFLLLEAVNLADEKNRNNILHCISLQNFDKEEKINTIKNIFNLLKIKEKAEKLMESYYQKACEHLDATKLSMKKKQSLLTFIDYLMKRKQ
ncbi:MAG: polyprenyl synthetase family protein [Chitinophagales bacterium]